MSEWSLLQTTEGITLEENHVAYKDVTGSLFYLSWTYNDKDGVKLDTVLQINSVASDTFRVQLPYKARLNGYTPNDGYSPSTVSFSCSSKKVSTYEFDKNKRDTDPKSVKLTEVKADGYSIGTFSIPVIVTYYDPVTTFYMTEFETVNG